MATEEETSEAGDDDGGEKGGGCIFWDLEKSFDADPSFSDMSSLVGMKGVVESV